MSQVNIAMIWAAGNKQREQAAAKAKATYSNRDKAKAALISLFAKQYGADTTTKPDGSVVWTGGHGGKGTKATMNAKKQLNLMLSMAFGTKKAKQQKKQSPIAGVVRALVKLTDAQFLRAVAQAKAERKS